MTTATVTTLSAIFVISARAKNQPTSQIVPMTNAVRRKRRNQRSMARALGSGEVAHRLDGAADLRREREAEAPENEEGEEEQAIARRTIGASRRRRLPTASEGSPCGLRSSALGSDIPTFAPICS